MSQILVWKSDVDGRLFEDKKKYQRHLQRLAAQRRKERKLEQERQAIDAKWNEFYNREMTIEEWPQFVLDNQDAFWVEAARSEWRSYGEKKLPTPRLLEFSEFSMSWSDQVSNSHSCPHNGVENWCARDKDKPTGYPGWSGRIEWVVAWPKKFDGYYPGGNLFKGNSSFNTGRQRAHTGTGGGGHMSYSQKYRCHVQKFGYDFRLYAADWPGMARKTLRERVWKIVSDREYA